jgi:hypothetical protein
MRRKKLVSSAAHEHPASYVLSVAQISNLRYGVEGAKQFDNVKLP